MPRIENKNNNNKLNVCNFLLFDKFFNYLTLLRDFHAVRECVLRIERSRFVRL
jgi:hypothetical protein